MIPQIHDSGFQVVLAITGGGSRAIADLLSVPGASRTVLEAVVPYSRAALTSFLGYTPEEFCGPRTARAMAMQAFLRAQRERCDSATDNAKNFAWGGLSATCSLASDPPKRGPHRAHLAWQTPLETGTASVELDKGLRSRFEEEVLVGTLLVDQLADLAGLTERPPVQRKPSEKLVVEKFPGEPGWRDLLLGIAERVCLPSPLDPAESRAEETASGAALFPGAFNPLHDGHRQMSAIAQQILGRPVAYELSLTNVDKPPLDYRELTLRTRQFAAGQTLWLTRAPTFAEKARLFPEATFVVGADTVRRIGDPKYYRGEPLLRDAALRSLTETGSRFLVFGRVLGREFRGLADLDLPPALAARCKEVPADRFRVDLSSTSLRCAGQGLDPAPADEF